MVATCSHLLLEVQECVRMEVQKLQDTRDLLCSCSRAVLHGFKAIAHHHTWVLLGGGGGGGGGGRRGEDEEGKKIISNKEEMKEGKRESYVKKNKIKWKKPPKTRCFCLSYLNVHQRVNICKKTQKTNIILIKQLSMLLHTLQTNLHLL